MNTVQALGLIRAIGLLILTSSEFSIRRSSKSPNTKPEREMHKSKSTHLLTFD